jgi:toxin ParE1/3/4
MAPYDLFPGAVSDLESIANYTIEKWGINQARRYQGLLEPHFRTLQGQKHRAKVFLKHRPELLVSRCEHHFIFHLKRPGRRPLILAVLRENMDLVARIRERPEG